MVTDSRLRARGLPPGSGESGFTLVEVMAAMIVFAIMSTAALGLLLRTTGLSGQNKRRVVAANLATSALERMRNLPTNLIPTTTTQSQVVVGGLTYTVTQTVQYAQDSSSITTCDSSTSTALAYKRIQEIVTWPSMGGVQPIRNDTLRSINISGLDPAKGALAVKVRLASGLGLAGVTATAVAGGTTTSQVTGGDGCLVFSGLPTGTATVTLSSASGGYVDRQGRTTPVQAQGVSAGALSRLTFDYDVATPLVLTPSSVTAPAALQASLNSSYYTPQNTRSFADCATSGATTACLSGAPGRSVVGGVFPMTYTAWASSCADADPVAQSGSRPSVSVGAGQPATVTVPVVAASVLNGGASPRTFYAVHKADTGCAAGESYPLVVSGGGPAALGAGASAPVALPYGRWLLTTNAGPGSATGTEPACNYPAVTTTPCALSLSPTTSAGLTVTVQ